MSNPTSSFGWQMPTSSDLVTDLPADFEVFGQAVDTTLADLKGGTTGQVLKKNSNTDMDFVWSADSAGMTNPMTTTGDTIYSSSGSTPARLGIGSTGQVLTVSGGLPAWATPAATTPSFVGCVIYNNASQTFAHNTQEIVNFGAEIMDTDGFHDNTTDNQRITIPTGKAGKYRITYQANPGVYSGLLSITLRKNGSAIDTSNIITQNSGNYYISAVTTIVADLAVADYITAYLYQTSGGGVTSGANLFSMSAEYLGA